MYKTRIIIFGLLILCFSAIGIFAQESPIVKTEMSQAEIDRIVKNFTAKEAEFRDALGDYVFYRNANIQTIGMGGQVSGVYRRESYMSLDEKGKRTEKIVFFPIPTIKEITVTPEDIEDLGGVNPFALEPSKVDFYSFTFVGKQKIDELDLYVFDVAPKVMPDAKSKIRLFSGRIWVDDRDLQIVKSKGKAVPETKTSRYPVVETWRVNVDGKYWFPAYSSSDDELVFANGQATKMKIRVRYKDYAQGRTDVKIIEETTENEPAPPPKKP
ncbi:hypothetical protein BH20ACI1_BH20ACI1_12480 [soil metagenome]